MTAEIERIWKEAVVAWSRYYPGICLERLKETTKTLSQDSRCPFRDSTRTLEYSLDRYQANPLSVPFYFRTLDTMLVENMEMSAGFYGTQWF
jgi:hypothetical protein